MRSVSLQRARVSSQGDESTKPVRSEKIRTEQGDAPYGSCRPLSAERCRSLMGLRRQQRCINPDADGITRVLA